MLVISLVLVFIYWITLSLSLVSPSYPHATSQFDKGTESNILTRIPMSQKGKQNDEIKMNVTKKTATSSEYEDNQTVEVLTEQHRKQIEKAVKDLIELHQLKPEDFVAFWNPGKTDYFVKEKNGNQTMLFRLNTDKRCVFISKKIEKTNFPDMGKVALELSTYLHRIYGPQWTFQ